MPQKTIQNAKTIVIKIGSVLISNISEGTIKQDWINSFCADVKALTDQGKRIVVVSSGGVALGRSALGIPTDMPPINIPLAQKQAASSIGQYHMFNGYHTALKVQGLTAAQVLLTISETENRRMYLNARETLWTLMERGVIPVINENDTVSTGELRFGDNDRLAVRVAQMIEADTVILLSTTEGLYTDNPDKNPEAKLIPCVETIEDQHQEMAGEAIPGMSTGGMKSKIEAARAATRAGISLIITNGISHGSLNELIQNDKKHATLFTPQGKAQNARKTWLQSHLNPKGVITIDQGARGALHSGKSLLPIGVSKSEGEFERGDVVTICTQDGTEIGTGIIAYNAKDTAQIIGKQSDKINKTLGYHGRNELIHRNDLALK